MFQLRSVPLLSDVAAIFMTSVLVLTPHGQVLGCTTIAFSQRYVCACTGPMMIQKPWGHLKILGARRVTRNTFHAKAPQMSPQFSIRDWNLVGPGELTRYSDSLWAGRSGDPIPVEARFSATVQTGPEAHPTSYTMGTGSFPGVKRPGVALTIHPI